MDGAVVARHARLGAWRSLVRLALLVGVAACSAVVAQDERWFERSYAVDLAITLPDGRSAVGALYVGDGSVRLETNEDDVPSVVLYEFGPERVVMRMLDPISTSVMRFTFELGDLVELDLLVVGAITLDPQHAAHPCHERPRQASCHADGAERIDGVPTVRWSIDLSDGFGYQESFTLWVSEDGTVRRLEYADGYRIDFVGYVFGAQPLGRFTVPDDYELR